MLVKAISQDNGKQARHGRGWHAAHNPVHYSPQEQQARAEDDAKWWAEQHRMRIRYDGCHQVVCSCSWHGERHEDRLAAERDRGQHG